MQFGFHLTLDLYKCPKNVLDDTDVVYQSLDALPPKIGMHPLTKPFVVDAKSNDKKDPGGFSGFIIIQESHISCHTFIKRGFVSIDVYSCKEFDIDTATSHFVDIFKPKKTEKHFVDRGLYYPDNDIY